jgi:thymidine phosphorylase
MRSIRAKMYGKELNYEALQNIINDIVNEYSNIEIAAFITACGGDNLNIQIIGLTKAMVGSGQSLSWNIKNGSRQTLCGRSSRKQDNTIVVSIVAAFGLTIPKTSSRATSQALQTVWKP